MFHKEGHNIIAISFILIALINVISKNYIDNSTINYTIGIITILILFLILQFFRNPKRIAIIDDNIILSPVDGKVVAIEKVFEKEYFKDERIQISIFMSPINVHVTRYALSGKVNFSKYHPGKYLVAWHPKSSTENERTTTVIKTDGGVDVLFRQIAGAVARRIRWYVKTKDNVTQGNEMGFIKFGSRVDVFVPIGSDINVEIGQKVKAAESLLGVLK